MRVVWLCSLLLLGVALAAGEFSATEELEDRQGDFSVSFLEATESMNAINPNATLCAHPHKKFLVAKEQDVHSERLCKTEKDQFTCRFKLRRLKQRLRSKYNRCLLRRKFGNCKGIDTEFLNAAKDVAKRCIDLLGAQQVQCIQQAQAKHHPWLLLLHRLCRNSYVFDLGDKACKTDRMTLINYARGKHAACVQMKGIPTIDACIGDLLNEMHSKAAKYQKKCQDKVMKGINLLPTQKKTVSQKPADPQKVLLHIDIAQLTASNEGRVLLGLIRSGLAKTLANILNVPHTRIAISNLQSSKVVMKAAVKFHPSADAGTDSPTQLVRKLRKIVRLRGGYFKGLSVKVLRKRRPMGGGEFRIDRRLRLDIKGNYRTIAGTVSLRRALKNQLRTDLANAVKLNSRRIRVWGIRKTGENVRLRARILPSSHLRARRVNAIVNSIELQAKNSSSRLMKGVVTKNLRRLQVIEKKVRFRPYKCYKGCRNTCRGGFCASRCAKLCHYGRHLSCSKVCNDGRCHKGNRYERKACRNRCRNKCVRKGKRKCYFSCRADKSRADRTCRRSCRYDPRPRCVRRRQYHICRKKKTAVLKQACRREAWRFCKETRPKRCYTNCMKRNSHKKQPVFIIQRRCTRRCRYSPPSKCDDECRTKMKCVANKDWLEAARCKKDCRKRCKSSEPRRCYFACVGPKLPNGKHQFDPVTCASKCKYKVLSPCRENCINRRNCTTLVGEKTRAKCRDNCGGYCERTQPRRCFDACQSSKPPMPASDCRKQCHFYPRPKAVYDCHRTTCTPMKTVAERSACRKKCWSAYGLVKRKACFDACAPKCALKPRDSQKRDCVNNCKDTCRYWPQSPCQQKCFEPCNHKERPQDRVHCRTNCQITCKHNDTLNCYNNCTATAKCAAITNPLQKWTCAKTCANNCKYEWCQGTDCKKTCTKDPKTLKEICVAECKCTKIVKPVSDYISHAANFTYIPIYKTSPGLPEKLRKLIPNYTF